MVGDGIVCLLGIGWGGVWGGEEEDLRLLLLPGLGFRYERCWDGRVMVRGRRDETCI